MKPLRLLLTAALNRWPALLAAILLGNGPIMAVEKPTIIGQVISVSISELENRLDK
jgi:hypothetical protein